VLLAPISVLLLTAGALAAAKPAPRAFVPAVIVINGVPMVPPRQGPFGMVQYWPRSKSIEIWRNSVCVVVKEGAREAIVRAPAERTTTLPAAPTRWQDILYVPLSLAEEFRWDVKWDAARGVATLTREDWGKVSTLTFVRMDLPLLAAQQGDLDELRRLVLK